MGTDAEPIEFECPECNGSGCEQCKDGVVNLHGCPNKFCRSITSTIPLIDLFHKGMPPIAGGSLDQSASFVDACQFFSTQENIIKAEAYGN